MLDRFAFGLPTASYVFSMDESRGFTGDTKPGLQWFGGDTKAAMTWTLDTDARALRISTVCLLGHLPGFHALAFSSAQDGIHFMIGGAVDAGLTRVRGVLWSPR